MSNTFKNVEEFSCIVCGRVTLRRTKNGRGRHNKTKAIRRVGSLTCSKSCAREYFRKSKMFCNSINKQKCINTKK